MNRALDMGFGLDPHGPQLWRGVLAGACQDGRHDGPRGDQRAAAEFYVGLVAHLFSSIGSFAPPMLERAGPRVDLFARPVHAFPPEAA